MSAARALLLAVVALAALASAAHASDRYDPRLRFRTLSTPGFDVHFHQGEEALARRLAVVAETVATELAPRLGRPRQRVHVILVAQNDPSNGWATPFPYDVIEITAAAPRGGSALGNTSDWLRLVFVHEYTHILHLDRSRGWFAGLGRVFGRHPLLLPNLYVPPWQIEGIATYHESAATGEGRVRAGDFRLLLDRAAAGGRFASLDQASSDRVAWPSGNTSYLYGGYFHQYLADTYGTDAIDALADATARRLPYLGSGAFREVFGKSLGRLWQDFEAETARKPAAPASPATRVTRHGFVVSAPAYAGDGTLYYSISNPDGFPALMQLQPDGRSRRVTTRVGGGQTSASTNEVVFDQLEYVRSVAVQSDLFAVAAGSGRVRRITREARAGDPDLSPDGQTIVCTVQAADRRLLATVPAASPGTAPTALLSEPDAQFAGPRWSPDGRTIAAERRRNGAASEIVLLDARTGAVTRVLTSSRHGRNVAPAWSPDGASVLFASDRGGGPFQIHVADLASGEVRRVVNAGESAHSPVRSPDGRTLTFVGYTADGFDLFSMPWAAAEWTSAPSAADVTPVPDAAERRDSGGRSETPGGGDAAGRYRPWPMLVPRFWTPIVEPDGEGTAVGAATAGADALGRHLYAAGAAWSTRGRPDWYAGYVYDRWRPTFFATASDDTDPWLTGTARTRELNVGATLPFRTLRRTQSVFAAVHASSDRVACADCARPVDRTAVRRALRGGWSFTTARQFGYSVSAEDGISATVSTEWAAAALGSSGDASAVVVDVRGYVPAIGRHAVLALRGAAAASWGDESAAREFGAGGSGPRPAGSSFDRDAIGLIRGFDTADVSGTRAAVLNADYRVPLAWIERGVGTWPMFLRSVHGAVFADGGAAWDVRLARNRTRASAGAEISADVVVGYILPFTVASGVAWRHDPTGVTRGAAWFARVGRAF